MATGRIVIITGPSSAGKTSIISAFRETQAAIGRYWHSVGVDDVLGRLHWRWVDVGWPSGPGPFAPMGMAIVNDGEHARIRIGPLLRSLLRGYQAGAVAIAGEGVDVLVEDVIFDQEHLEGWYGILADRDARFVDVRCDADEMARREAERSDRPRGLARAERLAAYTRPDFDLTLDTTSTTSGENARRLSRYLGV